MPDDTVPYLRNVYLAADVYAVCLQHALTTEKEEIMGLLIGELDVSSSSSNITACIVLHRSDKQPDRVEISPEQLCEASTYAEQLAHELKRPMQVLGWYHSHPHITVWPSHVDLRTQATYQTLDPLFVGIIFSVFASDTGSVTNKVEITCFQACGPQSNLQRREIPLTIKSTALERHNLEALTDLPNILMQEILDCSNETNDKGDELAKLHNDALKTLQLSHIVTKVTLPMCDFLETRLSATEARIRELELREQQLMSK